MSIAEIFDWAGSTWDYILSLATWANAKGIANSNFFTALFASLAGAFAGAKSAQWVAERAKLRGELIAEIRDTNAAIMLAFTVCDFVIGLKRQHVKALKENYCEARASAIEYHRRRISGEIQGGHAFEFKAELKTLPRIDLPTALLQEIVFEKISSVGRPLRLVVSLLGAISSLNDVIERRNGFIKDSKSGQFGGSDKFALLYFGLPYGDGHENHEYHDMVSAIHDTTDDVIFFSNLLCQDLREHGLGRTADFKRRFGGPVQRVSEVDFEKARTAGLMPAQDNYLDWMQGVDVKTKVHR